MYYSKTDYDKAISDFTEAIRLDPKSALYYDHRGNAYYSKEDNQAFRKADYGNAISDFTEAIRLDPKNSLTTTTAGTPTLRKGILKRRKRILQSEAA